jgi:hypothetical protein
LDLSWKQKLCFWTAGQDPDIAAGAATFVRANVLALFGMAWNQSAARYLAAQGIVTPASVRRLSCVLHVLACAETPACAVAAAIWCCHNRQCCANLFPGNDLRNQ